MILSSKDSISAEHRTSQLSDIPLSCSLSAHRDVEVWKLAVGLYTALEADRNDPNDRTRMVISAEGRRYFVVCIREERQVVGNKRSVDNVQWYTLG